MKNTQTQGQTYPTTDMTMDDLIEAMISCPQTKDLNVLEHGQMVHNYFCDIYYYLKENKPLKYEWKIPSWLDKYRSELLNHLLDFETLKTYQIYHDCGKPFCRTIDSEGKQHFPNHATVSADIWYQLTNHKIVSGLIAQDMDIHLLKNDGVEEFASRTYAVSLLLTGLAELHANASMFGGIDSISFKIKYKNIEKRGKAILKKIIEENGNN